MLHSLYQRLHRPLTVTFAAMRLRQLLLAPANPAAPIRPVPAATAARLQALVFDLLAQAVALPDMRSAVTALSRLVGAVLLQYWFDSMEIRDILPRITKVRHVILIATSIFFFTPFRLFVFSDVRDQYHTRVPRP
jgi:hypothetical protein